jgi:hypothetical protein
MNKKILFVIVCCFLVVGFLGPSMVMAEEIAQKTGSDITDRSFVSLFDEAHKHNSDFIKDTTGKYIKACCETRDAALKLLHDNGFKISIVSDPKEVEKINRIYDQSRRQWPEEDQIDYDEFISANRRPTIWRFWDIFAIYKVSLFIKQGKVHRVSAIIDRTIP